MNAQRSEMYQQLLRQARIRQQERLGSKPENFACPICGYCFEPEFDRNYLQWVFPKITENRICIQCEQLQNIREHIERFMKRTGIPEKYLGCTFQNFQVTSKNREMLGKCIQYVKDSSHALSWLYLYGNCGTGKTHLSVSIARELLLMGKQVMFTGVPKLCYNIRQSFQENGSLTELDVISTYIQRDYLVLDDLGVEKPTEWVKSTMDYIIYERDNLRKPTIITSNLSADDITSHIGDRSVSRIVGNGPVICLRGKDWRVEKRVVK